MKITLRIQKILYGTMWYNIKLLFDIIAISDSCICHSVVPISQYLHHTKQPSVFSANSLCWSAACCLWQNSVLASGSCEKKRWKSEEAKSGLYGGWSKTSHPKCCRRIYVAAAMCDIVMNNARQQHSSSFVLNYLSKMFTLYEAAVMVVPCSMNSTTRIPFWSQNILAIHFLVENVHLNFTGLQFKECECIHCLNCSFISSVL